MLCWQVVPQQDAGRARRLHHCDCLRRGPRRQFLQMHFLQHRHQTGCSPVSHKISSCALRHEADTQTELSSLVALDR